MDMRITLTIEQWQQVIDILSDGSVRRAGPLINLIVQQVQQQQQPAEGPPTNGTLREVK